MSPHDPDHLPFLEAMALDSDNPLEALAASDQADCAECRTELEEHLRVERLLDTNEADFRADLARGRALDHDELIGRGSAAAVLADQLPQATAPPAHLRLLRPVALLAAAALLLFVLWPDPEPAPAENDPMLGGGDGTGIELVLQPSPTVTWPTPPAGGWSDVEIRTLDGELLLELPELEQSELTLDPAQSAAWPDEIEVRVRTYGSSTRELSSLRQALRLR